MFDSYSGATRIYPVLGDPIAQAKSPHGITVALRARGRDAIVVPLHVGADSAPALLRALSDTRNVDGIIATVPYKFLAYEQCSSASDRSRILGSSSVLRRNTDGSWYGDIVDGVGFVRAAQKAGWPLSGCRALLLGAGGAGGAVGLELLNAGAALSIHDTDVARRDRLIATLGRVHANRVGPGSADPTGFDVVVNATPIGMRAGDPSPVDLSNLTPAMYVADVIALPEVTPLLEFARRLGCNTQTGMQMFAASAELTVDFFLGVTPA